MSEFEELEKSLRDALGRLYDPLYAPPGILYAALGLEAQVGINAMQRAIIEAIGALEPNASVPRDTQSRRLHRILYERYVERRTQECVATRMGITTRYLRMLQVDAVTALARAIWQGHALRRERAQEPVRVAEETDTEWASQLRKELFYLAESTPGATADLREAIHSACELARPLADRHGVVLRGLEAPLGLKVTMHPSALSQIILAALAELLEKMEHGVIAVSGRREADHALLHIASDLVAGFNAQDLSIPAEILTVHGGSTQLLDDAEGTKIVLRLPIKAAETKATVLVIDDNPDLLSFFRAYVMGTRYKIEHVAEGKGAWEAIEEHAPDIIVLDVMLPDIDGWKLLVHLHAHPMSRSIPVVVCSVVGEAELARSLGAVSFLPKPVGRRDFLDALGAVVSRIQSEPPTLSENSARTAQS